jgi:taurine--2-oxoglutarate transaminase
MANDRSTLTSLEREKASVFHSWSAQSTLNAFMVKDVTDEDGTACLDFSSQWVNTNLGHQHHPVVRAIQDQAALLWTFAPQHGYQSRYRAVEHAVHTARLDRALGVAAKYHVGN